MSKLLIFIALLALVALAACSDPAPTAVGIANSHLTARGADSGR